MVSTIQRFDEHILLDITKQKLNIFAHEKLKRFQEINSVWEKGMRHICDEIEIRKVAVKRKVWQVGKKIVESKTGVKI